MAANRKVGTKDVIDFVVDEFDTTRTINIDTDVCAFCRQGHTFGLMLKRLLPQSNVHDADEDGEFVSRELMDVEGVWASKHSLAGLNWHNLRAELSRSRGLVCTECGVRGATIGCFEVSCKMVLHLHCAMKNGYKIRRYQSSFLCPEHVSMAEAKDQQGDWAERGDISRGQEALRVAFVNTIDSAHPLDDRHYTANMLDSDAVQTNGRSVHDLPCCKCEDLCDDVTKCACIAMGRNYNYQGLLVPYASHRVNECNIRCSCSIRRCTNRVVQRGLKHLLEVVRLQEGGWSVRALNDIEVNSFVCELAGLYTLEMTEQPLPNDVHRVNDWRSGVDVSEDTLDAFFQGKLCVDSRRFSSVGVFIQRKDSQRNLNKVLVYDRNSPHAFPRLALFAAKTISAYEHLYL